MKSKKLVVLLVAILALTIFVGCGKKEEAKTEEPAAVNYAGDYQDKVSERAALSIVDNKDGTYTAIVDWSNGANNTDQWTMTLKEENGELKYQDGKHVNITFSETGNESGNTVIAEKQSGSFKILGDNELEWHGAEENETADFVK